MWYLLQQSLTHIIRTRLLFLVLVFSFFIQFLGIEILHSATLYFQGVMSRVGYKEAIFLALFFELFTGTFLAAIFGIWMIPYAHQGPRSALTFTLPVSKWQFAVSYSLSMLVLLLLQHAVMLSSYGMVFGFKTFLLEAFPWRGFLSCLLLETLAFEVFAFAFAVSSMTFGQIPTFFLATVAFVVLQITGAVLKVDLSHFFSGPLPSLERIRFIYEAFPPLGELVFDLRHGFVEPEILMQHGLRWAVWFLIFVLIFRWKLRYPARYRSSEM
jgi:hypothetical protein